YSGLSTQFEVDDLCRLCWIWEWDGSTMPSKLTAEDDNPFLEDRPAQKDWTRGAMGIVLSPATHHSKVDGKRVPAYGIGIEVEMDIDNDMTAGMASVARWTAAGESRREAFREKINNWVKLHAGITPVPPVPRADLPRLSASTKMTSLTRTLASLSPKSSLSPFKLPAPPSSPSRSPSKSKNAPHPFANPFPLMSGSGSKSPIESTIAFPQTPSLRLKRPERDGGRFPGGRMDRSIFFPGPDLATYRTRPMLYQIIGLLECEENGQNRLRGQRNRGAYGAAHAFHTSTRSTG
ncbi:hypothetical protein B0H13DRAFT_1592496, partial [Mycena leptocephala]